MMRTQELVGRKDVVHGLKLAEELEELLAAPCPRSARLPVPWPCHPSPWRTEDMPASLLLHPCHRRQLLEHVDVLDHRGHHIGIEGERLFQLLEDANEVEHESIRLHLPIVVLVRPVHPCDGLKQNVVAHRLVEVHAIEDGRVEPGQQFLSDNEDFGLGWSFRMNFLPDVSSPSSSLR